MLHIFLAKQGQPPPKHPYEGQNHGYQPHLMHGPNHIIEKTGQRGDSTS